MNPSNALRAFRTLVAAACVDGKISQPEMQLLIRKAKELGLQPPQVQQILQEGREGKLPLALPAEPGEFQARLEEVIDVVCADGRIESQERMLLLRFAARASMSEADLMARVRPKLQAAQQRTAAQAQPPRSTAPPPVPVVTIPPPPPPSPPAKKEEPVLVIRDEPRREKPREAGRIEGPPRASDNPQLSRSPGLSEVPKVSEAPRMSDPGISAELTSEMIEPYKPGPVTLGGPSPLSDPGDEVSPVALFMIKSHLQSGSIEETIEYLKNYANIKDEARARRMIERVLRENPDIKVGSAAPRRR